MWQETVKDFAISSFSDYAVIPKETLIDLIKQQAEITWKARDKEVEEARQEGFVKGHKVGRKEGIDEGIQRAELFMQRNLPINVELNPKWLAFKKEVSKGE